MASILVPYDSEDQLNDQVKIPQELPLDIALLSENSQFSLPPLPSMPHIPDVTSAESSHSDLPNLSFSDISSLSQYLDELSGLYPSLADDNLLSNADNLYRNAKENSNGYSSNNNHWSLSEEAELNDHSNDLPNNYITTESQQEYDNVDETVEDEWNSSANRDFTAKFEPRQNSNDQKGISPNGWGNVDMQGYWPGMYSRFRQKPLLNGGLLLNEHSSESQTGLDKAGIQSGFWPAARRQNTNFQSDIAQTGWGKLNAENIVTQYSKYANINDQKYIKLNGEGNRNKHDSIVSGQSLIH